ncbi:MAG: ATP-binding cassette domain-containing protein [Actinobacteria bacterium]|nr:ATP-binding cassette domain-containing protein [Actinomycetota bacterium]
MKVAIEADGLVKGYGKGVRALDGVTFSVEQGTVFGLLGPNGAGKSTTVKILTTLTAPDEGRAAVAGIDVVRDPHGVRRVIGVVGQKAGGDKDATGRENLQLQGDFYGIPRKTLRARIAELLDRFDLTDAADRLVRTYSGGMQRKLDVAIGLINEPSVLFLDEPTTGLDPEARAEMWAGLEGLARNEGVTVLLTTHYLEEADRLASQLAIVDRGQIVAAGTPDELKSELQGDTLVVELGQPTNGRVLDALSRIDGLRESTIDGRVLRARADEGARAIPTVLALLESEGVPVVTATVSRPSLDDVYLRHAGRTFGEAEGTGDVR